MTARLTVRRAVTRMRPYHPPLENRANKLRLDFNENTAGCSPAVRRALAQLTQQRVSMYPEYEPTRRRLAQFFRVRPEELLITNGTDEALRLVVDTFVESDDAVLLVEPTFAMYRFYAELAGARVVTVRYGEAMQFPQEDVFHALRARPRLFPLANPNNPTGTLVTRDILQGILHAAPRTLVVVDEAYFEFSRLTVIRWINRHTNLIVTRTFSKGMGLAGLRLGCLFANRRLTTAMRRAQSPYSVNTAALVAAEAAICETGFLRNYVHEVIRSREDLCEALFRLGIRVFPSGGNFVLADFGRRAPALLRALRRRGILLRDRQRDFGRVGYVRISIGTRAQTRRLIRTLEKLWPS